MTLPESFLANVPAYREAYARDGVVLVPGILDAAEQALARQMFDWSRMHPGQASGDVELGGPNQTVFIDTHSSGSRSYYLDMLGRSAMPAIARRDSERRDAARANTLRSGGESTVGGVWVLRSSISSRKRDAFLI